MRFSFLRCAPLLLIAALGIGCGDDNTITPDQPAPQATPTPAPAPTAAPTPSPAPVPPPPNGELQSVFGTIDALDSTSINLSGRIFMVDSETRFFDHQTPITFSNLEVGQTAVVKARQNKDGVWFAREVKLREP